MRKIVIVMMVLAVLLAVVRVIGPGFVEDGMNRVNTAEIYPISEEARSLHNELRIMDWHSDALLWDRNLLQYSDRGHTDFPRLRQGGVAIQMFTTVTKSPSGQNYNENASDSTDNITYLALLQMWPVATWRSLKARALHQADRLKAWEQQQPEEIRIVRSKNDLHQGLMQREENSRLVLTLLGIEGGHALDGELDSVDELADAGFRMFGLQHFFDNRLGGSLHGQQKAGLTPFGRDVVTAMNRRGIIIDVSHSSEAVVVDVLELSKFPVVVSHTGLKGACDTERNISDDLMKRIADAGGLVAIGFWDAAVCDPSPQGIVKTIRYAIDLLGEEHVALGSDYDGAVAVDFDVSQLAVLTDEMLKQDFSQSEIRNVMGENSIRFLMRYLPDR